MCYLTTRKVSPSEYFDLSDSGERYAYLGNDFVSYKGFDHNMHYVDRRIEGTHETERVKMQWGFLPPYLKTEEDVKKFRFGYKDGAGKYHKGFTTLNATSEELLSKMYKEAALKRRCLIPVHGFYEWMHVQVVGKSGKLLKTPEKFPYLIQMRKQDEFFLAGIWQPWVNHETKITVNTYAIVTTEANTLMKQIHNSKERMPTILPGDLANAWLYKDLSDQNILDVANYGVASAEMIAIPLHKDFLKNTTPHEEVLYKESPQLVYT